MKTDILVITDRSGSMASTAQDVIDCYNTFIREQREVHGQARVTFAQFDHAYEVVYAGRPVADVPTLDAKTFVPRGNTALLDAIGRTLNEQGQRIATEGWADLVIVCILTDGGENASREYDIATIRTMTAQAEKTAGSSCTWAPTRIRSPWLAAWGCKAPSSPTTPPTLPAPSKRMARPARPCGTFGAGHRRSREPLLADAMRQSLDPPLRGARRHCSEPRPPSDDFWRRNNDAAGGRGV